MWCLCDASVQPMEPPSLTTKMIQSERMWNNILWGRDKKSPFAWWTWHGAISSQKNIYKSSKMRRKWKSSLSKWNYKYLWCTKNDKEYTAHLIYSQKASARQIGQRQSKWEGWKSRCCKWEEGCQDDPNVRNLSAKWVQKRGMQVRVEMGGWEY